MPAKAGMTDRLTDDPRHLQHRHRRGRDRGKLRARPPGPGGQNVNKLSTAVQLRFDVRHSPSLPNDVAIRLMRLAGKRLTKDGVIVLIAQSNRTPGTQPRGGARAADRSDPRGLRAPGAAPSHQADQASKTQAAGRQEESRQRSSSCGREGRSRMSAVRAQAGPIPPTGGYGSAARATYDVAAQSRRYSPNRSDPCPSASSPRPSSTASPPARWSSGRRARSRNWSRTRSMPARARIEIVTDGGGRRLIRVTDDGAGMTRADLALAVERHATSKLDGDDLLAIATLGFRGEALPSIGAVAQACRSRRGMRASRMPGRSRSRAARSRSRRRRRSVRAPASRCATCSTPRRRG